MTRLYFRGAWISVSFVAAICYLCILYKFLSPFYLFEYHLYGGENVKDPPYMEVWLSPQLRWNLVMQAAICVLPTVVSFYIGRRSGVFLMMWTFGLLLWAMFICLGAPFGVDGQNGCEICDFGRLLTTIVSWTSIIFAGVAWAISTPLQQETSQD